MFQRISYQQQQRQLLNFRSFKLSKCKFSTSNTSSTSSSSSTKTPWVGIAFFSSICLTAAGLGVWQARRYQWKVDMIEEIKKKVREDPIEINDTTQLIEGSEDLVGRRLFLKGRFDHSREVLLGPRSPPPGLFPAAQGMASNPQGYYIITPMLIDRTIVFINRGWVPKNAKAWPRPEGENTVAVVCSSAEKKGKFSPKNDPASKKLLWLEEEALLAASEMEADAFDQPFLIADSIGENTVKGNLPYLRPLDSVADYYVQPVTHLSYAVTWFSLSTIGFYMTYLRFKSKRIRPPRI